MRLNGALLERPSLEAGWPASGKGWLVFKAQPRQFALGKNLVGLRLSEKRSVAAMEMTIEKLEVHVNFR